MRRPVLLYPDARLHERASSVTSFGPELTALVTDLQDTMDHVSAIGLTAPHVGELQRVVLVRLSPRAETLVYLNPAFLWASPELASHDEGSVSMPGVRETLTRPARVRLRYQTLAAEWTEADAAGFEAAVLQHEIDQLDGIFWIDRLSRLKRERLLKRYDKLRRTKRG